MISLVMMAWTSPRPFKETSKIAMSGLWASGRCQGEFPLQPSTIPAYVVINGHVVYTIEIDELPDEAVQYDVEW